MIKDDSFFGFSRTGKFNDFSYPGVLETGRDPGLVAGDDFLEIAGEKMAREIVYPDHLRYSSLKGIYETDNLAVIPNGIELLQRPARLIEKIMEVRRHIGFSKLIYVQGVGDPFIVPVLVYAGVSLFDDSYAVVEGMSGVRYTMFGKSMEEGDFSADNMEFLRNEFGLISKSIRRGTLREIVEKFGISSKALEILRILDRDYYGQYEQAFLVRTPYIKANSIESLDRPDLVRYREKLIEAYRKPEGVEVALIMPCSARKPYSTSKSHQAVLSKLTGFRKYIHEIIVTSPVGVVPRELEEAYPARFYDIPVIGMWYEEEKKMMSHLLSSYFQKNPYGRVIAFLPEDLEFLVPHLPAGSKVVSGSAGNMESLDSLRKAVKEAVEETGSKKGGDRKLETYRSIAAFQFGQWIREYLENVRIMNTYNQDMLVEKGEILLVYNKELGKFSINKKSAAFFVEKGKFLVEIDDFKPTANVYAVGVNDCTDDIRQEDEVVMVHNGEVRGVGIAKMPGGAMKSLKKGIAVKVRN